MCEPLTPPLFPLPRVGAGRYLPKKAAQRVSFIIVWPADNSWYLVDRLTGSLPFALSAGTPIITSSAFAAVYNLHEGRGALVVESVEALAAQLAGAAPLLTPARYQGLIDTTWAYREAVREKNNGVLDALLGAIPGPTQQGPLALPAAVTRFRRDG